MKNPHFDKDGIDRDTFAPFILRNALDTEWADVRLEFSDWDWLHGKYGDTVDGYYLNGYGVEGLDKATRSANGLDPWGEGIDYNSEGDACYVHFKSMEEVLRTAALSVEMISSVAGLKAAIQLAEENGWADG
jgi:hypothetical protein